MTDKFCVNCKHCITTVALSGHNWLHCNVCKEVPASYPVHGEMHLLSCDKARAFSEFCGKKGSLFEPKVPLLKRLINKLRGEKR